MTAREDRVSIVSRGLGTPGWPLLEAVGYTGHSLRI